MTLNGSAGQIFEKSAELCYEHIRFIIANTPKPAEQEGKVTQFERRNPEQSELKGDISPTDLYDLIRMMDAETYPHAYTIIDNYKVEFTDAQIDGETVTTKAIFKRMKQNND